MIRVDSKYVKGRNLFAKKSGFAKEASFNIKPAISAMNLNLHTTLVFLGVRKLSTIY